MSRTDGALAGMKPSARLRLGRLAVQGLGWGPSPGFLPNGSAPPLVPRPLPE